MKKNKLSFGVFLYSVPLSRLSSEALFSFDMIRILDFLSDALRLLMCIHKNDHSEILYNTKLSILNIIVTDILSQERLLQIKHDKVKLLIVKSVQT